MQALSHAVHAGGAAIPVRTRVQAAGAADETQLQRLTELEELVYSNFKGPAVDLDDVSMPMCMCLAIDPSFVST